MQRTKVQIVLAIVLVCFGWAVGRAQTSAPDFELVVDAPSGDTKITCVRGCELTWVERGVNPNAKREAAFTYGCTGSPRCSSARVGGWLIR